MSLDRLKQLAWIYGLNRLGQEAVETGNDSSVYQRILQHIVDGFEADSGSLALLDHADNCLTIVAVIDLPDGVIGKRVNMGEGVFGWVTQQGQSLLLNGDASSDPRFQRYRDARGDASSKSAICWPLKIEDRTVGCVAVNRSMAVSKPDGRSPFAEADMEQGSAVLGMVSLALSNIQLHIEQKRRLAELQQLNAELEAAQSHLLQSEKMASIGQLAAGVAHEINNPIGYVYSNMGTLEKYVQDTFSMLDMYEQAVELVTDAGVLARLKTARDKLDIAFIKEDLRALMNESKDGITRVKRIVQNLKDFSHVDTSDMWHFSDLHQGLDSTLNIVNNEIKYKAEVVKEYGDLPEVECLPSQINQVFMNLLVNAAHAIEERGTITIRTGQQENEVWVDVADTGKGINPEHLKKIFDPFFTTKPVGEGTGLGLPLSFGIIQKHHGRIEVQSEVGKGTTFRVWLPIEQPHDEQV
ncbi:MAG: histidine kinase [Gallionellales bacterium RBG_16_57_15]|nr:MAG: histidine kinase [Gallionellales bacterium RBG_16_57_15]